MLTGKVLAVSKAFDEVIIFSIIIRGRAGRKQRQQTYTAGRQWTMRLRKVGGNTLEPLKVTCADCRPHIVHELGHEQRRMRETF